MSTPRWRPLPTRGPRRWLFRTPLLAFRARLGWLFGGRLVMIEHQGRTSGKQRQVVVEVVVHDSVSGAITVASGYGPTANWYRNLLANPEAHVVFGARRIAVRASPVPSDAGADLMVEYARRRPRSASMVAKQVGLPVDGSEARYRELGRALPYLRLEPQTTGEPAGRDTGE